MSDTDPILAHIDYFVIGGKLIIYRKKTLQLLKLLSFILKKSTFLT